MNKKEMMEAIGGLDDRYIMEFARPERKKTARIYWAIPAAACLCLLMGAVCLYWMGGEKPPVSMEQPSANTTLSTTLSTSPASSTLSEEVNEGAVSVVIWAEEGDMLPGTEDYGDYIVEVVYPMGMVTIHPMLQEAMEQYSDPNVRFAVGLRDIAGAERAVVYEQVTQAQGLDWDGESKVLFLTRAEIDAIQCPEEMALFVEWMRETDENADSE